MKAPKQEILATKFGDKKTDRPDYPSVEQLLTKIYQNQPTPMVAEKKEIL